jgi:predicted glycosyltransferase
MMNPFNRLYYDVKPHLPWGLRIAIRRWIAQRKRWQFRDSWPIKETTGSPPPNWPGWPEGKRFALVLTHDVEGERGLRRCQQLSELERAHGFRSSFNFIPEGDYITPKELRIGLAKHGFEVGVHDLTHDGKLYRTRESFLIKAARINHYLKAWNAVGFRSAFMHHNYEWLRDLNVLYDSSSFDTDPFEPQPDGVHTIFPLWKGGLSGYVELPYTLPQDSTLFILLGESDIGIWKSKLDWIARQGGMALIDTHPDYMRFGTEKPQRGEYPAAWYEEFLCYIQTHYSDQYWHALPREVAEYVAQRFPPSCGGRPGGSLAQTKPTRSLARRRIWIDLDNTPHVPFFIPIIRALEERGHSVLLTARDAFQVCELADQRGLAYAKVGRHHGRNKLIKALGLFGRAAQMLPLALKGGKPDLALSHGARSQIIASNFLGIPSVLIADYEYAKVPVLMRPQWEIVPEVIPDDAVHCASHRVRKYPGIKEDVYVPSFRPDPSLLDELGLRGDYLVVTVRPPATEAHYHNPESEILFVRFMERICGVAESRVVLLPRNKKQESWIRQRWPDWFEHDKTIVPAKAVDGLNLVWHSDFVVSGGGTMNREAAALGVPVYSIFRGHIGAVDRHLQKTGRLVLLQSVSDVETKIRLERRLKSMPSSPQSNPSLTSIIAFIEDILEGNGEK